jgi:hypothetical protein
MLPGRPLMQTMASDELIEARSPSYLISSIHTGPERTALVAVQNSNGLNVAGISHAFCQCREPRLCENIQVFHSALWNSRGSNGNE